LEPEILIVDEVLAVGDADFQKKCLGKMKDVSINEGRTVLFVSHNMAAVTSLCDTCILMKNGEVEEHGKTMTIIDKYIITGRHMDGEVQSSEIKYDQYYEGVKFEAIRIRNKKGLISNNFAINEEIKIEIDYSVLEDGEIISPSVHILDGLGNCILATSMLILLVLLETLFSISH
jgi:lipopolysaccharide transport system ATP-binding protein